MTANVLPDWWAFTFIAVQLLALPPLVYSHLSDPINAFKNVIPSGYDPSTDAIRASIRVQMSASNAAQSLIMIGGMLIGCTLFARNSLRGQPILQQRLIKLPVYAGLFSDIWLYCSLIALLPRDLLLDPSKWTPGIKGIAYGLPGATTLKLVWLMGIGRDVV